MPKIPVNELVPENLDALEELNETFEKITKGKKFDDGTTASKHSKKKGNKRVEKDELELD